jgi:transcriptional regulator GlxA family with amidase domain
MSRRIGFFVYHGYQMLDLSGPLCVFEDANLLAEEELYQIHVFSAEGGVVRNSVGLGIDTLRIGRRKLDTLIVVGGKLPNEFDPFILRSLLAQSKLARRIASVCTGAFLLAQAGLLTGKRATTHWRYAHLLEKEFPQTKVNGDAIFVKDGNTWTSAGIAAGMDLALALIQEDHGISLSKAVAQDLVIYHRRPGGQTQFSALADMSPATERMQQIIGHIRENLSNSLSMEELAGVAHLSVRQFGRIFKAETGETPSRAVERIRAEVAHSLVEQTSEPVEMIAEQVGFSDPERMRRAFLRIYGHPPQAVRRNARMVMRASSEI